MPEDQVMQPHSPAVSDTTAGTDAYDPFVRGPRPVGVRTIEVMDTMRGRHFPCEVWYPAAEQHAGQDLTAATQDVFSDTHAETPRRQLAVRDATAQLGHFPLIVFSHSSGGRRRQSTFLCTHLSSHGYIVAALDHSEVVAPELRRAEGESDEQRAARVATWITSRVPDIRLLLDRLLDGAGVAGKGAGKGTAGMAGMTIDAGQIGLVGHSFGGWTALATPEADDRIRAVVALAPGGSSQPPPNVIPAKLTFAWGRDVPTLYLVAGDDSVLPLAGMYELFERTQATKRMFILGKADHGHFADEIEQQPGMCLPDHAHTFARGLTLCHLDATLRHQQAAEQFWLGDVGAALAARGIEAIEVQAPRTLEQR
jgi:dienelactone hydrolase